MVNSEWLMSKDGIIKLCTCIFDLNNNSEKVRKEWFEFIFLIEHILVYVWDSKTMSGTWPGQVNCKTISGTLHFTMIIGCKTVPGVRLSGWVDGNTNLYYFWLGYWSHLSDRMPTRLIDPRYTSHADVHLHMCNGAHKFIYYWTYFNWKSIFIIDNYECTSIIWLYVY